MSFLLVRMLNFPNLIVAHFHLYQNSRCPKLDAALPCCRPYLLSVLHPWSACTHSPVYPSHSQTLRCTLLFQAFLLLQNFCFPEFPPPAPTLVIPSSRLTPPTAQEKLLCAPMACGMHLHWKHHLVMEWSGYLSTFALSVSFLQAGACHFIVSSPVQAHCLTLNRHSLMTSQWINFFFLCKAHFNHFHSEHVSNCRIPWILEKQCRC